MTIRNFFSMLTGTAVSKQGSLTPIISKGAVFPMEKVLEQYKGPESLPLETKVKLVMMGNRLRNAKPNQNMQSINYSLVTITTTNELVSFGNRFLAYIHRSKNPDMGITSPMRIIELLRKYGCVPTSDNGNIVLIMPGRVPQNLLRAS